ncbi:MAG: hypothetical protein HQM14_17640 [SAR324 cluster bacterium]|nr:hypothetical protein [SAR324 cluster bacterium]
MRHWIYSMITILIICFSMNLVGCSSNEGPDFDKIRKNAADTFEDLEKEIKKKKKKYIN